MEEPTAARVLGHDGAPTSMDVKLWGAGVAVLRNGSKQCCRKQGCHSARPLMQKTDNPCNRFQWSFQRWLLVLKSYSSWRSKNGSRRRSALRLDFFPNIFFPWINLEREKPGVIDVTIISFPRVNLKRKNSQEWSTVLNLVRYLKTWMKAPTAVFFPVWRKEGIRLSRSPQRWVLSNSSIFEARRSTLNSVFSALTELSCVFQAGLHQWVLQRENGEMKEEEYGGQMEEAEEERNKKGKNKDMDWQSKKKESKEKKKLWIRMNQNIDLHQLQNASRQTLTLFPPSSYRVELDI